MGQFSMFELDFCRILKIPIAPDSTLPKRCLYQKITCDNPEYDILDKRLRLYLKQNAHVQSLKHASLDSTGESPHPGTPSDCVSWGCLDELQCRLCQRDRLECGQSRH